MSYYHSGAEKPCERHKSRILVHQSITDLVKIGINDFLGVKQNCLKYGIGPNFHIKLYRFNRQTKENFIIQTQLQWDLERPLFIEDAVKNELMGKTIRLILNM